MKRVRAEVLSSRRVGPYHTVTLVAPEIAERARPGQFIEVAVPPGRDFVLRRPFSIHRASRQGGWAGTLELSFDPETPHMGWAAGVKAHEFLDVIGPLGRGFSHPRTPAHCLLVAQGYSAGSLYFLAEELKARGRRVDMLLAATTHERVFKPIEGKRLSQSVAIVTGAGYAVLRANVVEELPRMIGRCATDVVYAAGPRELLRAVADLCMRARIPSQVAVEERMGCGLGQCLSCVVPVASPDGSGPDGYGYEMVRSCVEGPVFNSSRIVWDAWLGREAAVTPPEEEIG